MVRLFDFPTYSLADRKYRIWYQITAPKFVPVSFSRYFKFLAT